MVFTTIVHDDSIGTLAGFVRHATNKSLQARVATLVALVIVQEPAGRRC